MLINERIRAELKTPVGRIVPEGNISKETFDPYFGVGLLTVCVGDRTTERVHEYNFSPGLEIVDSLEKRISRQSPPLIVGEDRCILKAKNPPGYISGESLRKLDESLDMILNKRRRVRLEIDGEEDLLALPVIGFFPEDTTVFYGQPNVGVVIVTSKESRARARHILNEMGIDSLNSP